VKRLRILLLALIALPLAACDQSISEQVKSQLPYPPADIQACFRGAANLPDKALSVSEVESLWKQDRVRVVVQQRCGLRLLAWYKDLQDHWQ
jgi:hypothetical protein